MLFETTIIKTKFILKKGCRMKKSGQEMILLNQESSLLSTRPPYKILDATDEHPLLVSTSVETQRMG